MNDNALLEFINGEWYYKGLSTDSVEDHADKCPACKSCQQLIGKNYLIAHGQIMQDQCRELFGDVHRYKLPTSCNA